MTTRLSLLGGRASGKSTWLGCTWLASRGASRLQMVSLPNAIEPLKILSAELLQKRYPNRTNTSAAGLIRVPLRWKGDASHFEFELEVADFDGEELDAIFRLRESAWTDAWDRRSQPSVGTLLFLRPSIAERVSSNRLLAERASRDVDSPEVLFPGQTPAKAVIGPGGVSAPSEVTIVETLQFMRHTRAFAVGQRPEERLGVVLSCWDELPIELTQAGPDRVLAEAFPLLYDFIYTNHDASRVQVFGLSATGGDLKKEDVRQAMEDADRAVAESAQIVWRPARGTAIASSKEIALPLGWMVEGDGALK